jgi:hypothetical protein
MGNSEFQLDMETAEIINQEEALKQGIDDEQIQELRNKISGIHSDIEDVLYNTNLVMGDNISPEKLVKINNIVQELEKATINLGGAVSEK